MPQFIMPTDGKVEIGEAAITFENLDDFTRGYVEGIFFTECHVDNPELEDATFGDLDPETLADIMRECREFQTVNATALEAADELGEDAHRAGTDFWFTRNGHGVGFWDRDLGEVGDRLDAAANRFGSRDVYRGDDGKLYLA